MSLSASLLADFEKSFPSSAVEDFSYIDTGFAPLNEAMSGDYDGGFVQGRLYEIVGESGTGKTGLVTDLMANAQGMGGAAGFVDWERAFNLHLAKDGYGLSDEKGLWMYDRPKTWEAGNMAAAKYAKWLRANKVIAPEAPIVIGLDSIASAVPASVATKELDEYTMNDTTALARVSSTTLKTMAMIAEEYNTTFVYLNQLRLKPGVVYGDPRTTPGGKAMEFYASGRIMLGREKVFKTVSGAKELVGFKIGIEVVKSKFTKPFKKTAMRLGFNDEGCAFFDKHMSMVDALVEAKLLPEPRPGFVMWDGTQIAKAALAEKARAESLLPKMVSMIKATAVST